MNAANVATLKTEADDASGEINDLDMMVSASMDSIDANNALVSANMMSIAANSATL